MEHELAHLITSEEELRAIIGSPREGGATARKATETPHEIIRAFIARSPFVLVASSDAKGNVDVSPKGDPPGFVQVLDERTLAIPERPGNHRADTFSNILQNSKVGLIFLIPGRRETLRVSGTAQISSDLWLREKMVVAGNTPKLALVIDVEEAFIHCPKCMLRSNLWESEEGDEPEGIPSLAQSFAALYNNTRPLQEFEKVIAEDARDNLY